MAAPCNEEQRGQATRKVCNRVRSVLTQLVIAIDGKFMNLNFPSITRRGLIVIDPKPGAVFHLSRRSQCNGFFKFIRFGSITEAGNSMFMGFFSRLKAVNCGF